MVFKGTRDNITCRTIRTRVGKADKARILITCVSTQIGDLMLFVLQKLLGVARTSVISLSLDWHDGYTMCRSIDLDVNIGLSYISSYLMAIGQMLYYLGYSRIWKERNVRHLLWLGV